VIYKFCPRSRQDNKLTKVHACKTYICPYLTKVNEAENTDHSYVILRTMYNAYQDVSTYED